MLSNDDDELFGACARACVWVWVCVCVCVCVCTALDLRPSCSVAASLLVVLSAGPIVP